MLERELVSAKAPEAGFTAKSCALLGQYDPATCSWKTSQQSFLCSELWSVTWPRWGMTVAGCAYEHRQSVRRIIGIGGGAWPTPVANDDNKTPEAHMRMKARMKGGPRYKPTSLNVMVKGIERGLWPTPRANDAEKRGQIANDPRNGLPAAAQHWPTPTRHNAKEGAHPAEATRNTPTLAHVAGGKLNPTWVEWLMAWPLAWTVCAPSATARSRSKRQPHGDCSEGRE